MRAGQPFAVASDGIDHPESTSTPSVPIAAPATRSQRGSGLPSPREAVHHDAEAEPERLAERRDEEQEQHRDGHPVVGAACRRTP